MKKPQCKSILIIDVDYLQDYKNHYVSKRNNKIDNLVDDITIYVESKIIKSEKLTEKYLIYTKPVFQDSNDFDPKTVSDFKFYQDIAYGFSCEKCNSFIPSQETTKHSPKAIIDLSVILINLFKLGHKFLPHCMCTLVGSAKDYGWLIKLCKRFKAAVYCIGIKEEKDANETCIDINEVFTTKYNLLIKNLNLIEDMEIFKEMLFTLKAEKIQWKNNKKNIKLYCNSKENAIQYKKTVILSI